MLKIMKYLSLSSIITTAFSVYVIYTLWTLGQIFLPPECKPTETCFSSYLSTNPVQHLVLFTSVKPHPQVDGSSGEEVEKVHASLNFNYMEAESINITLKLPRKSRNNGTLYMHVALLNPNSIYKDFNEIKRTENLYTFALTKYIEPKLETFNLLQDKKQNNNYGEVKPYTHIATVVPLGVMTDNLKFPYSNLPGELYPYIRVRSGKFLPIIQHNELKSRLEHFQLVNSSMKTVDLKVTVSPVSYGLLRLSLHIHLGFRQLKEMGFGEKDIDDVKGIFADTNLILLSATVLISSFHLLFDFLAFKNDVSFWHKKKTLVGLSGKTVLWRAFSQLVIFFYLLDEKTSLLVLIPSGISAIIEAWKVTKVLHLRVSFANWRVRVWRETSLDAAERSTAVADAEAMRYLSMILYPLCVVGAIYSLIYYPHKSWYSWILRSVVNGVYAFGFLLMLPQLFVNYRLKSVAALPWRAFMYKAFNTFIDDVFAFIITMPTAHRMACFRDDIVFLIYLYQRWLYPVDKSRTDTGASMDEASEETSEKKTN